MNPYDLETLSNFLKGKVVIVTGGNSGIGKAIVEMVARLGAKVVIDYRSHPEATEELEQEIGELGGCSYGVQADVGKLEDLQHLIQAAVERYGRIDVMVNNAGIETRTSIWAPHQRTLTRSSMSTCAGYFSPRNTPPSR